MQSHDVFFDDLLDFSGYEASQINPCVKALWKLHCRAPDLLQKTVQEKYAHPRYDRISTASSSDVCPCVSEEGQSMDES